MVVTSQSGHETGAQMITSFSVTMELVKTSISGNPVTWEKYPLMQLLLQVGTLLD